MHDSALGLIATLLAASAQAHTQRSLVRALANALDGHVAVTRIELRGDQLIAFEKLGTEWSGVETRSRTKAVPIGERLAVVPVRPISRELLHRDFRAALDQLIENAIAHIAVVQRVADVSRRAHAESRELRADLQRRETLELVARSPRMREALARVEMVAVHPTTVLLTGESGSGKEVMAREIHRLSLRAHQPMLQLNCAAIPEPLVESELFGHERGSFTSADRRHEGLFERAHRGTVFLDEVGELPLAAQAKLLRVLQERKIRRVGGTQQIDVDVRLIAATNRPLAAMVEAGQFREDLFYRLDVFAVRVPSLRERHGDIAPLANALVAQLAEKLRIAAPPITRSVLRALEAHAWPGNVRELANVLETALVLGGGESLVLPAELGAPRRGAEPRFQTAVRDAIEKSLRDTRGKIYGKGGSAERLGLKPATLQSKMKKLGIRRADFL